MMCLKPPNPERQNLQCLLGSGCCLNSISELVEDKSRNGSKVQSWEVRTKATSGGSREPKGAVTKMQSGRKGTGLGETAG